MFLYYECELHSFLQLLLLEGFDWNGQEEEFARYLSEETRKRIINRIEEESEFLILEGNLPTSEIVYRFMDAIGEFSSNKMSIYCIFRILFSPIVNLEKKFDIKS